MLCYTNIDIYFFKVFTNVGYMEPKDKVSKDGIDCSQDACCNQQDDSESKISDISSTGDSQAALALQAQLEACKATSEQWQNRYIQLSADMQNYKRRMEKEQLTWTRRAQETLLLQLLPIVDDFDRAIAEHKKHSGGELTAWMVGFEMISKELYKFLSAARVTEITRQGAFDPILHEAIAQVDAPEVASGDIVEVIQKGYLLGDEVLRPAKVTVAR